MAFVSSCVESPSTAQDIPSVVTVESLSPVRLFCDPTDCSTLGSSVHGILPVRIMETVAISFSRGSSRPRGWTHISCIGRWVLYHRTTREAWTFPTNSSNQVDFSHPYVFSFHSLDSDCTWLLRHHFLVRTKNRTDNKFFIFFSREKQKTNKTHLS